VSLRSRLVARIGEEGPLSFADFVDAALYDPTEGFYARGVRLGLRGAYSTAPTRQSRFTDAVAAEVRACHEALGAPRAFALVEAGPGDGSLAVALWERLRETVSQVVLIERAAGMRAVQERALEAAGVEATWAARPEEVRIEAGFVVANEVFDALPFHLLEWPEEVLVTAEKGGRLTETLRPAPAELVAELTHEVEPRPGGRYAVRPEAPAFLTALALTIARGRILVADYGGEGADVHTGREPVRTYVGGMRGASPLEAPGAQDLTTDVDFGPLRAAARETGLVELAYEPQEGWRERVAPGSSSSFDPAPGAFHAFKILLLEARRPQ
jgi:NADH dehydrogenase [ubiquinone] 1 alpha subcomplex assembly factor 7